LFYLKKKSFSIAKRLPFLQRKILSELQKTKDSLEEDVMKMNKGQKFIKSLPSKGMSEQEVVRLADDYLKLAEGLPWKDGAISGCVYGADKDLEKLTTQIYSRFAWTNPMHADVFPDVRKMEAEVVRWVCTLFRGDEKTCGTMSSGGTESIMLACRAYRERALARGIRHPEIVCPVTAHAAFDKAADFFCMKIHHVPVDPKTKKVSQFVALEF
jgi:sphinganine-1-phosphate aldolase